jgi:superfamily II DNA or RNA helicase
MNNNDTIILKATEYGLLDDNIEAKVGFSPQLIINDHKKGLKVLTQLKKELDTCSSFCFSVAFITYSGINILLEKLKELENKNIQGKIITSNYLNFSEPKALERLLEFSNLDIHIYEKAAFHIKGYMFDHKQYHSLFVGSSNLTHQALLSNKEWNLKISGKENGALLKNINNEIETLYKDSIPLTKQWLEAYTLKYNETKELRKSVKEFNIKTLTLEPNFMQRKAVEALSELRENGETKAILVSATGTGKTYLSAFDVKAAKPKKLLFLAHREQLLIQAEESFKTVLGSEIKSGFLSGKSKEYDCDYLFSTMNMMAKENIYSTFSPKEFDYIIIDEAHRSASNSYQNIINYFKPKFLFGMTATPSRTDAKDVLAYFDNNIALKINLQQAMEFDLLCPFHYFGISEISIDGEIINDNTDINKLSSRERVKNIIDKIKYYGYSSNRAKGLIFCSRNKEAKDLSNKFNNKGYKTLALSGESSQQERESAITRLERDERDENSLDYIFTVDIFNEGVDIPSINQIILLRPTQSAVIFIQQLGRGLRKWNEKEFVVVLDFIGNYENNYYIPMALSSDKSFNREVIRKTVSDGSSFLAGCSTIEFDQISKHQIYKAIDNSKLGGKKNIKEAYTQLKNELAHIPSFKEFERNAAVALDIVIDNYGSYYQLVKECEKDNNPYNLSSNELIALNFITKKIGKGKHYQSIDLLKQLIHFSNTYVNESDLKYETKSIKTAYTVLSHQYNTIANTEKCLQEHQACILAEKSNNYITTSQTLKTYIQNPTFVNCVNDVLKYAEQQFKENYIKQYKNTNLSLFKQYSYEEVCKALNWEKNQSAVMNGYMFNEKTNTFPVFINYEKEEEAINYQDHFESNNTMIAISKKTRKIGSKDWKYIYEAKQRNTKIYLFVRKNKASTNSKDFYFLGEIEPIGDAQEIKIQNTIAFKIRYKLETPVREDIYEYFTIAE